MQTFDSVQSECFVHAAQRSLVQIGVVLPHRSWSSAVHWTQVPPSFVGLQAGKLASWQSVFIVHLPPLLASPGQPCMPAFAGLLQKSGFSVLQPVKARSGMRTKARRIMRRILLNQLAI